MTGSALLLSIPLMAFGSSPAFADTACGIITEDHPSSSTAGGYAVVYKQFPCLAGGVKVTISGGPDTGCQYMNPGETKTFWYGHYFWNNSSHAVGLVTC
ncbi:hypothetical protein UG55_11403 [Frankia sp. EI5c]|nr:hypothetical protein UG55_11403 [Frankia sp. EI5c]